MTTKFDIDQEVFIIIGRIYYNIKKVKIYNIEILSSKLILYSFEGIKSTLLEKNVYSTFKEAKIRKIILSINILKIRKYIKKKK